MIPRRDPEGPTSTRKVHLGRWPGNRDQQFAAPLTRACQIIDYVLLTLHFFRKSAMQTNSDSIFEHKTRTRATIFGICARTIVSCLRSAHARGAVRGVWERAIHTNFQLCGHCFLPVSSELFFTRQVENLNEQQSRNGAPGRLLTIRGAHGLHVSPRHGAPKAAQT